MKIAFITEDGKSISQHFGRAPYYLVMEIEDGKVVNRDMRDKLGHNQFADEGHHDHDHSEGSGLDPASHGKHGRMAEAIKDCDTLICGGMGMGAYQSMQIYNITPLVTDRTDIEEALQAYLMGDLDDQTDLLH